MRQGQARQLAGGGCVDAIGTITVTADITVTTTVTADITVDITVTIAVTTVTAPA